MGDMSSKTLEKAANLPRRGADGRFMPTEGDVPTPDEFAEMTNAFNLIATENFKLSEKLANVEMMADSAGWTSQYELGRDGGLSLGQLRMFSKQLRELVVGNPFAKRGSQLRIAYVCGDGVEFTMKNKTNAKTKPLTAEIKKLMLTPAYQRYLFSGDAHEELERAAYTDGNLYVIIHDVTKKPMRIAIDQITADLRNPDNPEEVWAYRRVWSRNPNDSSALWEVRWYYTDFYDGIRKSAILYNNKREMVDTKQTLVDKSFNRQIGWAFGVPDSLAVIAWVKLYKEFLVNGYIMSRALAQIAYKITVGSQKSGSAAALQVATPGQGGQAYVQGQGNDLSAVATAGRGYDFESGRPLAAAIATGLEVSTTALTSDAGSGSGGRAAEQTLDGPARAMATRRRKSWDEFWGRVFRLMGVEQEIVTTWHDLTEEQIQRRLQAWNLADNSGLFESQIIQDGMAKELGIANPGDVPAGRMLPNNEKSLARKDIDRDGKGGSASGGGDGSGNPSAGTGQGQGTGDGGLGNDHSTD